MRKLTSKQELFCQEYIKELNGTQAAISAGYKTKTAASIASENLTKPNIKERLAELQNPILEKNKIDADYVLKRLVQIDEMDALDILDDHGNILPISEWPKIWRQMISGLDVQELVDGKEKSIYAFIKKIKWPDKVKNLELIGKHIEVGAFSENLNIKAGDNLTPWGSIEAGVDKKDD